MSFFKSTGKKSDSELAKACVLNDEKAFEELIRRYKDLLYSFCIGFLKDANEAEDMVQETFLKFYESLEKTDFKKSIKAYFFTIARNSCIDSLRKKKPLYSESPPEIEYFENPFDRILKSEEEKKLYAAIDCLSENEKTSVFLKYKSGLKYSEIAEIINRSESAVESILVRARKKIKKNMQDFSS